MLRGYKKDLLKKNIEYAIKNTVLQFINENNPYDLKESEGTIKELTEELNEIISKKLGSIEIEVEKGDGTIRIGDKIRINEKADENSEYSVTKTGSEGKILKVFDDGEVDDEGNECNKRFLVNFSKTTGDINKGGTEFTIGEEYLEKI